MNRQAVSPNEYRVGFEPQRILETGGGTGTPSPPSFYSSSEAGRSRCHSLRSFFLHRRRLTRLRVPTDIKSWRTQSQPIRTIGEITAHIKILPVRQPYLYQKLSQKATQLRLLGMTFRQIARSLHINRKTATEAYEYERR